MSITRRQFLRNTGLITAGSFLGPALLRNPFVEKALADMIGDRYLVVIFLDGGNDGLNTVPPLDNGSVGDLRAAYEAARKASSSGGLRLLTTDLAATQVGDCPGTGTPLALHPGLASFKNLYDLGKLAVIQGCGYPDYNLSHDEARRRWQTGDPTGNGFSTGWVGRYLAANYLANDIPGVTIGDSVAKELLQGTTSVLAISRLSRFSFPYDTWSATNSDRSYKDAAFDALASAAAASAEASMKYAGDGASATFAATQSYPPLHSLYQTDRGSWSSQYSGSTGLNTSMARDLREVAKIVYGVSTGVPNVNARYFEVRNGGYDTHSDQGTSNPTDQQYRLHQEVAQAVELFYNDCADMGVADKVCLLVWSEFSRRIEQNDNGTDHGSQGPMFVIGGSVTGGVYGNHPDINDGTTGFPKALDNQGNTVYSQAVGPHRSTDFRDVYGTVLKNWLNMPEAQILLDVLPLDSGSAADYWTVQNFDLGFV